MIISLSCWKIFLPDVGDVTNPQKKIGSGTVAKPLFFSGRHRDIDISGF